MTVDLDPIVAAALDRHVPAQSGTTADWADVARRAATPGARGRRLPARLRDRRVWFGIGAVAVALGCAGAIEHHRIYRLFGGGVPAAGKDAEQRLVSEYRWPRGLHVLVARSRLVFQLRQPDNYDRNGRPTSWSTGYGLVAPLSNGAVCEAAALGPGGSSECTPPHTREIVPFGLAPTAWRDAGGHLHVAPYVFWGVAPAGTASMQLLGPGRERIHVPLSPIRLRGGVVYALRVPRRLEAAGHRPTTLLARNAAGAVIARDHDVSALFIPAGLGPATGADDHATGPSGRRSPVLLTIHVAGFDHRISVDRTCLFDAFGTPRGRQDFAICGQVGGLVPSIMPLADRAAVAWGRLPLGAATITVRYAHHSEPAVVYDRSYLFAVSTAALRAADLPREVVARTASGAVVARQGLRRSLFPGY